MHRDTGARGISGHAKYVALTWAYLDVALVALIELLAAAGHPELEARVTAHRSSTPVHDTAALTALGQELSDLHDRVHRNHGDTDGPQHASDAIEHPGAAVMAVRDTLVWYRRMLAEEVSDEAVMHIGKRSAAQLATAAAPVIRDARVAQWLSLVLGGLDPTEARAVADAVLA